MKTYSSQLPSAQYQNSNEETRREMQNFVHALRTYPDRFAREPKLSFEQHLFELTTDVPEILRKAASAG